MNPQNKRWLNLNKWLKGDLLVEAFRGEIQRTQRDYPVRVVDCYDRIDLNRILHYALNPVGLEDMSGDGWEQRLFAQSFAKAPDFNAALMLAVRKRWHNAKGRKQIVCRVWLIARLPFLPSATSDDELACMASEETGLPMQGADMKTARKAI